MQIDNGGGLLGLSGLCFFIWICLDLKTYYETQDQ